MDWQEYVVSFRSAAKIAGKPEDFVVRCLEYAGKLNANGLPVIYDETHLAKLVGYQLEYILGAAYDSRAFYRSFQIPKKAGGLRKIQEPLPSLKEIQRWLLANILYRVPPNPHAKGFVPNLSIKDNARFHLRQRYVLNLDLRNFFPTVSRRRVQRLYRSFGYTRYLSNVMARLSTLGDSLPQGAPTSPAITNLICRNLDRRLAGYSKLHRLRYTRYADDITISGEFRPGELLSFLTRVVTEEGFEIHPDKIRVLEPHQRQKVTGIIVNEKLQAPRSLRRRLRQEIYFIERYGLNDHLLRIGERRRGYVRHLRGLAEFVLFVNPSDREALKVIEILSPANMSPE